MSNVVVSYDGKKIQPAPFVSINKTYDKTGDGEIIGSEFGISLNGTLVAFKGSPQSSGTFNTGTGFLPDEVIASDSRLASILRKQDALRGLFSNDGRVLDIQSADGSQPLSCNPRVVSINFPEGLWFDRSEYTISLVADKLRPEQEDNFDSEAFISSATETWALDTVEDVQESLELPVTYRLTHTVSAVGKRVYDINGGLERDVWRNAKNFVVPRLGLDSNFLGSSGVLNLGGYYTGFNHVRNEQTDEIGGNYSVTETWVISSGSAFDNFEVSTVTSSDDGLTTVTINGSVIGLEERDTNYSVITTKYDNAVSLFSTVENKTLSRSQTFSGKTLNINPVSTTIGRNPLTGVISYAFGYDTRISNCVPGAVSEVITITDNLENDSVAIIPVLGRALGPVLQDIGTRDALTRSLNLELVMITETSSGCSQSDLGTLFTSARPSQAAATSATIKTIKDAADPTNEGFETVFVTANRETWEPKSGRYSLAVDWVYH